MIIPVTQDIVLERFSDSAGAYITLDSNNPSVYKQLYRAAKAKLKLRIKVSTVDSSKPKSYTDAPEVLPTDQLSPNCYVPPAAPGTTTAPEVTKTEFGLHFSPPGGMSPPIASCDLPGLPSLPTQVKTMNVGQHYAHWLRKEQLRKEQLTNLHLCPALGHMNPATGSMKPSILDAAKNAPTKTEAKHETSSPLTVPVLDNTFAESINNSMDPHISIPMASPVMPVLGSTFTICCNSCDVAIPNVHWHCSSCDNGDFDLCVECVNKGVLCDSKDHWLIKRFVQNGKVTTSITEKIEPRKAPAINTVLTKDASGAKISDCKTNVSHEGLAESRTCNSCVSGMSGKTSTYT